MWASASAGVGLLGMSPGLPTHRDISTPDRDNCETGAHQSVRGYVVQVDLRAHREGVVRELMESEDPDEFDLARRTLDGPAG
jgi:hypothetical protein